MPSVNLRELRDTKQLKAWLNAGQTVELRERNQVLGRIVPAETTPRPAEWPDFEARLKRIYGDRLVPAVKDLVKERESRY
jgi:antitoxin (DNA-binding transcriptional repressor) of toxin-antitoxin stability system